MTADKPQPATTGISRLRSTHRTTARRNFVANERNNEITKHTILAPTVQCHFQTVHETSYSSTLPFLGQR